MKRILSILLGTLAAVFLPSLAYSSHEDADCICGGTGICMCGGSGRSGTLICCACEGTGRCRLCAIRAEVRRKDAAQNSVTPSTPRPSTGSNAPLSQPNSRSGERTPCDYCSGTGKNPTDDLSGTVPTFGNDQGTTYCSICGRTVTKPHIHGPCPVCHGTRYIQR